MATELNVNVAMLYLLESICICAVNVFILITGYFMWDSYKRDVKKPIELLIETSLASVAIYIVMAVLKHNFNLIDVVKALLPANYYAVFYVVLFFVSLYLNVIFKQLKKHELKKMLIILFIFFSVWPTICDVLSVINSNNIDGLSSISRLGGMDGYTIVHFVFIYLIGAFLGKYKECRPLIDKKYYALLIGCIFFTAICGIAVFMKEGFNLSIVYGYSNPVIVIESVMLFIFFEQLRLEDNKIISNLAKASFTIYLAHVPILRIISRFMPKIMAQNFVVMLTIMCVLILAIVVICYIIHKVWDVFLKVFIRPRLDCLGKYEIKIDV